MVDGNKLGDVGFSKIGTPYSEMDCQAFVEWCLRQCGCNKDLAGSNAWYREVLKNGVILSPEECVRQLGCVPKGAFLFIHAFDGGEPSKYHGDGIGNASHIGLCTIPRGEGAINSSKSRGGVCESKFKKKSISGGWNKVGLWNQVEYDYGGDTPVPEPEPTPDPEPAPEPMYKYAEVWSANGKPVNTRKGPDETYALSKAGKIPVGTVVEVLENTVNKQGERWSRVCYTDSKGTVWYCWIKDDFLKEEDDHYIPDDYIPDDYDPGDTPAEDPDSQENVLYTVTVRHLSEAEANVLLSVYPDAERTMERG